MSLADEVAKRKAQERADAARRANPELEARLDRFIDENPQIVERLSAMSKEELIQRLIAEKMERAEVIEARNRELEPWVNEHPEIVAKVEERLKNVVAERRSAAAKITSAASQIRPQGSRIRI